MVGWRRRRSSSGHGGEGLGVIGTRERLVRFECPSDGVADGSRRLGQDRLREEVRVGR